MTKRLCLSILAATCAVLPSVARSAPVPGFHHPANIVHPDNDFASRRSGGLAAEWMFRRDWLPAAQSYGAALKFADCVYKFSPAAGENHLGRSAADPRVRPDLLYIVQRHRSCAGEQAMLAPMLLRVAFAEVALRNSPIAREGAIIGVPEQIGEFPVARIAECQVRSAPALVADLLRTAPGAAAEDEAAARLFGATPRCSALGRGAITPTAARVAVVEAAFKAGKGLR